MAITLAEINWTEVIKTGIVGVVVIFLILSLCTDFFNRTGCNCKCEEKEE